MFALIPYINCRIFLDQTGNLNYCSFADEKPMKKIDGRLNKLRNFKKNVSSKIVKEEENNG